MSVATRAKNGRAMAGVDRWQEIRLGRRGRLPLRLRPGIRYVAERPLTVDEFYELVDEDTVAELVNGEIVVPSPTSYEHESLFVWLLGICSAYVEARKLGEVLGSNMSVRIDEHNARMPDILFVSAKREEIVKRLDVQGPPEWVVEIVASDSGRREAVAKQAQYEGLGVGEIWRIDIPRRKLTVVSRKKSGEYETAFEGSSGRVGPVGVPGLELRVEWLWKPRKSRPDIHRVVTGLLKGAEKRGKS